MVEALCTKIISFYFNVGLFDMNSESKLLTFESHPQIKMIVFWVLYHKCEKRNKILEMRHQLLTIFFCLTQIERRRLAVKYVVHSFLVKEDDNLCWANLLTRVKNWIIILGISLPSHLLYRLGF